MLLIYLLWVPQGHINLGLNVEYLYFLQKFLQIGPSLWIMVYVPQTKRLNLHSIKLGLQTSCKGAIWRKCLEQTTQKTLRQKVMIKYGLRQLCLQSFDPMAKMFTPSFDLTFSHSSSTLAAQRWCSMEWDTVIWKTYSLLVSFLVHFLQGFSLHFFP